MSALLITSAQVKEITGTSKNVQDKKLLPRIEVVHLELKHDIGTEGYDILIAAITADDTLATEADLLNLRDNYIRPWMAWRVLERAGISLYAEPDRNGTFVRGDDTHDTVSAAALGMLKADNRDMAGTYKVELHDFLKDNVATFTWYDADDCEETPHVNTGGIITRKSRWGYPYGERTTDRYPDEY